MLLVAADPKTKHGQAADGLKLMCRLNENGELETIPGACKDGYGVAIEPNSHNAAPHFIVAVRLGKEEWGVRLLPQREDGTVGCAAHLNWELRNDRLYSLALREEQIRTNSAEAMPDVMTMTPGGELGADLPGAPSGQGGDSRNDDGDEDDGVLDALPLTMQAPHAAGARSTSAPTPVRWTRGHDSHMEEEKLMKMGGTLKLTPVKVNAAAAAAGDGSPARGSFDRSSAADDDRLSVLERWSVKDENAGLTVRACGAIL